MMSRGILHPRDNDRWLGIPESGDPRPAFDLLPYDSDKLEPSSFQLRASG
jgi:hypothetical protein